MRNRIIIYLGIFQVISFVFICASSSTNHVNDLKNEQKIQILKDIVKRDPFLKSSSDMRLKQFSIGKFFNIDVYRKLKGNDILGYEHDEGFTHHSDNVFIRTVRTTEKAAPFRDKFIRSLKSIAGKNKIRVSRTSQTEMGIGLLDVEAKKTEFTLPGALVEVYFKNRRSGKYFYYRFGTGKNSGLEEVFNDIWSIIFSVLESFR